MINLSKIVTFLKDFFGSNSTVDVTDCTPVDNTETIKLMCEQFAINVVASIIAGCISKCEFKTFQDGKEFKGHNYYMWNYEPNINCNSSEFIQQFVMNMLTNDEALIVPISNQYFVADDFTKTEYTLFQDIFDGIVIKSFSFNKRFQSGDVFYFRNNNKNISVLLHNFMDGYNQLLDMAIGKYRRSGGRKGTLQLDKPESGDEEKKKEIEVMISKTFKNYFKSENAVARLPKGATYTEQHGEGDKKTSNGVSDVRSILDDQLNTVAIAFKLPPVILKGNVADVDKAINNFLTFCIDPLADLIETEINRKLYGEKAILSGNYLKIDTTRIRHIDIFAIADKIDKLIADGVYSIDGILEKVGDVPIKEDWSMQHYITKNYTKIENIDSSEGGEK